MSAQIPLPLSVRWHTHGSFPIAKRDAIRTLCALRLTSGAAHGSGNRAKRRLSK